MSSPADALKELNHDLRTAQISYSLLSNFEEDPATTGDIDLFVGPDDRQKFLTILKLQGWFERREGVRQADRHFYYKPVENILICLDVKFSLTFIATSYQWTLNSPFLPLNTTAGNIFPRPQGIMAILLYTLHITTEKSRIEKRHLERLARYQHVYEKEMNDEEKKENELIRSVLEEKKVELSTRDFEAVIKKYFTVSPAQLSPVSIFGKNFNVLFIGTDGAGKTTLIETLITTSGLKTEKMYLGEKNWALPVIGRIFATQKNPLITGLIRYILYPFDLWLRHIKTARRGAHRLVLIDRIPGFPFLSNRFLATLYRAALPRIDQIVLLTGAAEAISQRKPELTPTEVQSEIRKWERVAAAFDPDLVISLDTTQLSIPASAALVFKKLLSSARFRETLFKPIIL